MNIFLSALAFCLGCFSLKVGEKHERKTSSSRPFNKKIFLTLLNQKTKHSLKYADKVLTLHHRSCFASPPLTTESQQSLPHVHGVQYCCMLLRILLLVELKAILLLFLWRIYIFFFHLSFVLLTPAFSFAAISYLYTKCCHKKIVYKYKAEEKISILLCLM